MVLVPILLIDSVMEACAPFPMESMAITAATPMMIPSMVKRLRVLLRKRARQAMRKIIPKVIASAHSWRSAWMGSSREAETAG